MTNAQKIEKINYYEFMLARLNLSPRHKQWVKIQLENLRKEAN
jgi:hypothetical protein